MGRKASNVVVKETMGRKAIAVAVQEKPAIDHDAIESDLQALPQLAATATQQDAMVRAVALKVGYQLPGDSVDADLIQRDISANMRRSVESCLEVGRGLCVLKEACGHGNFIARLDVLGIEQRVAQRFMQSAIKFSNASLTTHLTKAIGNQTKLFEMLVLEDEQIEELALTGQTGELKLDEVAGMSVKELRAAVRNLREDLAAEKEVKRRKDERINTLEEENARLTAVPRVERTPGMEEEERLRFTADHSLMLVREIEVGLRSQFSQLQKLFPDGETPNHVRLAQQQALSQVIQSARVLAGDFGVTLKLEDSQPQELLWLTQGEALFGDAPERDPQADFVEE